MEKLKSTIEELISKIGFQDFRVELELESEAKKMAIFLNEDEWLKEHLPRLVLDVNYLANLISRKQTNENVFIDINNYRKDRERIIIDLAKAAARKALLTKTEIQLPAMNAYERRLIHVELATRPDVKTESIGEGLERGVVIKPI